MSENAMHSSNALAANVELLLLVEPTAGLDPLMEVMFQECNEEAQIAGITVLLSSHILSQVEELADRISIIKSGRIYETGTLHDLRHRSRTAMSIGTTTPFTAFQSSTALTMLAMRPDRFASTSIPRTCPRN